MGNMKEQSVSVIDSLRSIGATVIERRGMHQKVAIVDNEIAWEGSLNILSHRDTNEHMRRFSSRSAIEEIIKNMELENTDAAGTQTDKKCPGSKRMPDCKGFLVIRVQKKTGRKFLGCSNYPRCDYSESLEGQKRTYHRQKYGRKKN